MQGQHKTFVHGIIYCKTGPSDAILHELKHNMKTRYFNDLAEEDVKIHFYKEFFQDYYFSEQHRIYQSKTRFPDSKFEQQWHENELDDEERNICTKPFRKEKPGYLARINWGEIYLDISEFWTNLLKAVKKLDKSGEKHILLLEEVPIQHMCRQTPERDFMVDLSVLSKYKNVHFIIVLNPRFRHMDCKKFKKDNFKLKCCQDLKENQYFIELKNMRRNTLKITQLMGYLYGHEKKLNGFLKVKPEKLILEDLPKPLDDQPVVIWINAEEDGEKKEQAVRRVEEILSNYDTSITSVAILYNCPGGANQIQVSGFPEAASQSQHQEEDFQFLKDSKSLADKIGKNNHEIIKIDLEFGGCEADVVVYVTNGALKIQVVSRARKKLIIVTHGDLWTNPKWGEKSSLDQAVETNLVSI